MAATPLFASQEIPTRPTGDAEGPTQVGNYRLQNLLGRGGMGEVFLAWDERLERHVAIKRILSDPPPSEQARARFRREARAIARLSHPAIVQIFDLLETPDGDCLVMEYVEGRGLSEMTARGPMDLDLVLRLAFEIADGLADAHAKGLVHRDLKPENVRVVSSGSARRAKILDFGLARLLWADGSQGDSRGSLTQSGALLGTIHAMSPEQASGRPVDHRSDLFALGGLIYEMLTGRAPFRGLNVLDTLRRVTSEEPEPLAERRPGLPVELVQLAEQLMAKEPGHRPQNARLVADVLERLRQSQAANDSTEGRATETPNPPPVATPGSVTVERPTTDWPAPGSPAADLPTGEWPKGDLPEAAASGSAIETVVRTLLLTDLVDSTRIVESLGDARAAEVWARHDRVARDLLAAHGGLEIDKSDGFLALFERPFDAVAFALAYHHRLAELSAELSVELEARVGIHLGEVRLRRNPQEDMARGAKAVEVEGLAKPMTARLMSLASPRQTLLSHGVFDLARRSAVGDRHWQDDLQWLAHGGYQFQGVEESVEVYEVGVVDFAPLTTPPDSEKARREVSFADELMLGWRPAAGQEVPRRPHWLLEKRLGEGGFGEVWLAAHESSEKRVFKFCFEASRLRALKREVTLFRLLKEALGHRDDIARVLDWNFDASPYFLEAEHTDGGDLVSWAEQQGSLTAVPIETRIELVAQVADALAAAHSVGVLHKDVKPQNVLITHDAHQRPRVRLTDFGVGVLVDRSQLDSQGVPALGFTETLDEDASTAGSRRYMAPELLEGKPASMPADLYSLGVVLYQMVVGDFSRALAPGWRRDVEDELLAEDIARLVDGSPSRRAASGAQIAERLRSREQRLRQRTARRRQAQRRRQLRLLAAVGSVLLGISAVLAIQANLAQHEAERLQGRAELAREQAEGLIGFMLGDLRQKLQAIGRLDALEGAGEQALEYFANLDSEDVGSRTVGWHAKALHQMGDVRMAQGRLDDALDLFQRSLAQNQALAERHPVEIEPLFELGQSHFWVGNVHWRQGELDAALPHFETYLEISQQLAARQPDKAEWILEVSYGHNNVGDLLRKRGNLGLALEHFTSAFESARRLSELDPENSSWRARLAAAHLKLAWVSHNQGLLEDARRDILEAVRLFRQLVGEEGARTRWSRQLAIAQDRAANIHLNLGDLEAADEHSRRYLALVSELHELDPSHAEWRSLLTLAHALRGDILGYRGRPAAAREHLRTAVEFSEATPGETTDPQDLIALQDQATANNLLAKHLLRAGEVEEALEKTRHAAALLEPVLDRDRDHLRIVHKLAEAHLLTGLAFKRSGASQSARESFLRAKELLAPVAQRSRDPITLLFAAQTHRYLEAPKEARPLVYTLLGMNFRHPMLIECCATMIESV